MLEQVKYVKLEIFIPESHFRELQRALQEVDAGHIGEYDSCLAYSRVTGTWHPLAGASPYEGNVGEISEAPELKVEVRIETAHLNETLAAVRAVHPYETPAIFVIPLWDCTD